MEDLYVFGCHVCQELASIFILIYNVLLRFISKVNCKVNPDVQMTPGILDSTIINTQSKDDRIQFFVVEVTVNYDAIYVKIVCTYDTKAEQDM